MSTPLPDSNTPPVRITGPLAKQTGSVLVVDDDDANRQLLKLTLEMEGHTVVLAKGGQEALDLLREHKIDVILLDLMMPDMDGYEVLCRLKADSGLQSIPVIVVSALSQMDSVARCIELGAEDYLTKPYKSVLLLTRVDAGLEKKRRYEREQEYLVHVQREQRRYERLARVVPIGMAFYAEKNFNRLLDEILRQALTLANVDAGVLYLLTPDDRLQVAGLRNTSLHLSVSQATGQVIPFSPLRLHAEATGEPNHHDAAAHVALTGQAINVADAAQAADFDFSGARLFDRTGGYVARSVLTLPLKTNTGRVLGVLQLINAIDPDTGRVISFDQDVQHMLESLASMAAMACENKMPANRSKA